MTTPTTAPASNYQGRAAPGTYSQNPTTAPAGSSKNKPATGADIYSLPVLVEAGSIHTTASHRAGDKMFDVPVTKRTGSTYVPLGVALQSVYKMTPAEVKQLQEQLIKAGLLSRKAITSGIADEDTVNAYQTALLRAANYGKTPGAILDEAAAAGAPELDATGGARAPFSPQVSNPAEIKAALSTEFTSDLGHGLSDAELDRLTTIYQSLQVGAQRQTYDTAASGGTATSVEPLDVFAAQQAEKIDPNAVQANKFGTLAEAFRKSLSNRSVDTASF